jgi:hypothetical protein
MAVYPFVAEKSDRAIISAISVMQVAQKAGGQRGHAGVNRHFPDTPRPGQKYAGRKW